MENKHPNTGGTTNWFPKPYNQQNQLEIANLKNQVIADFGTWLQMDSQVPPRRILAHPLTKALAAGNCESASFEEVERLGIQSSLWNEAIDEASRYHLDEAGKLRLIINKFREQSCILKRLIPVKHTNN